MNRRTSFFSKVLIVFAILFYCMYFVNYTWGITDTNDREGIIRMHYKRGIQLYKQAEYSEAIEELESVLYIDPSHAKAKKYLKAAVKRRNKHIVTALYKEASGYYKQQNYEKALESYQNVLEVVPDDGYALYKIELLKAKIEKEDRIKQSARYKQRAEEIEMLTREGVERKKILAREEEAKRSSEVEFAKQQRASEMSRNLAQIEGYLDEKERISLAAIKVSAQEEDTTIVKVEEPKLEKQEVTLPSISLVSKEEVSSAKLLEPSNEEKIEAAKTMHKLGKQYYAEKDFPRAIATFKQVVDFEKIPNIVYTPQAKKYIAKAKTKMQDQERAIQAQQLEEETRPLYKMAKQLYADKNYPRAIATFQQIIELEKNSDPVYSSYAKKYIAKADKKMQDQVLIDKKSSQKSDVEKVKSLYVLAKEHYSGRDYDQAIVTFQKVIESEKGLGLRYTPYAKKYIETAQGKIAAKEKKMQLAKNRAAAARKRKEDAAWKKEETAQAKIQEETISDKIRQIQELDEEFIEEVVDLVKESTAYKMGTVEKEVSAYSPPPEYSIHQKLDIPVNMNFQDVDVVYVLDYLSEVTGTNIVMSGSITDNKRTVSIKVKDMPLQEALKYVLKSAGLNHRIDKNVIWIATPQEIENEQMETEIFILRKGTGMFTKFSSPTSGGVALGSAADITEQVSIKDVVEKAVSWPSGSRIVLDERLGALIVTNTPYNLGLIDRILEKIDVEPVQVLIETRFLEITVTDLSELGIDWEINSDLPIDKTKVGMVHGIAADSGVNFTNTSRSTEGFNLTYQGVLTKPQFQIVIHALEESQKVKTLSAPRITTLDNQMATMKIVDEWIYPTRYEFQIVQNDINGDGDFNDAGETQYKNVPTDFVKRDVGILLRVTPSVGIDDETITLTLIPEVSEGTAGFFSYAGDVTLPLFTSRNLATSVVVNNGDTVVLGGLMKETQTKVETKVPFLGDLPWIGAMFRKDTDTTVRKNLLIFVTASILSSSGQEIVFNRVAKTDK